MNEKDELRVLIPYRIEHKNEHVREFRDGSHGLEKSLRISWMRLRL